MRAVLLLLPLLLPPPALPRPRCPGDAPPVPVPLGGRNETRPGAAGAARAPDVAALVAVGGWLGAVLLCVGRFVRRSREATRLHLQYLRALPCGARPRPHDEELQPLSGGAGSHLGGPEG